jgi:hypothetical protein
MATPVMSAPVLRAVRAAARARVPVLLWGEPGIGKTAVVESLAAADLAPLEVVVGSLREPSDLNGLPVVGPDGDVSFAPPAWARRLVEAGRGWLFLDELSTSPPAVQAAMLRVCKEGWVGDLRLPDEVVRVAAANDLRTAADGWQLAPATANRFCHVDVAADLTTWLSGMTVGWDAVVPTPGPAPVADEARVRALRARVAAFVRHRPALLHAVPDDPVEAAGPWPSPRTWEYLAATLAHVADDDLDTQRLLAVGLVGTAAAHELLTWLVHHDLPDPEVLLDDPSRLDVDDRDDRLYAVLGGVVAHVAGGADPERWAAAAAVLGRAAAGRRGDLAAPFVADLLRVRPEGARVPAALLTAFRPVLEAAGLVA